MGLPEISDWRKLWYDALGGTRGSPAGAPPDLLERHRAALLGGIFQLGRGRSLDFLPAHLYDDGVVPPPLAAGPAESDDRSSRGESARICPRRLRAGTRKRRRAHARRASENRRGDRPLHRTLAKVHRRDGFAH